MNPKLSRELLRIGGNKGRSLMPSNQSVNKLYVGIVQHSATLHSRKNTSVHSRHFLHTGCMVWAVTSPKNYETSVFKTYKLVRPEKKTLYYEDLGIVGRLHMQERHCRQGCVPMLQ